MKRENAINLLLNELDKNTLVICGIGKVARELYELRKKRGEENNDFLMLGSMGCAVPIGLGVALNTKKNVVVITGDGSFLMKMGSIATLKKHKTDNLKIFILNNYCHDSTGGQPTAFKEVKKIVDTIDCITIIDIERGARKELTRPDITCSEIKDKFMAFAN